MGRSGYSDDCEQWSLIRWRGQVASAISGKRGQQLLLDLYRALDAMPVKELIADELETTEGAVCALGALGKARKLNMMDVDVEDYDTVAEMFGVAHQLTQEIVYMNDEAYRYSQETPAHRYERMKQWVLDRILPVPLTESEAAL